MGFYKLKGRMSLTSRLNQPKKGLRKNLKNFWFRSLTGGISRAFKKQEERTDSPENGSHSARTENGSAERKKNSPFRFWCEPPEKFHFIPARGQESEKVKVNSEKVAGRLKYFFTFHSSLLPKLTSPQGNQKSLSAGQDVH